MRINHVEVIFHIQVFYRPAAENLSCAKENIEVRNGRKLGRGSRKKLAWPPVLPKGLRWITSCLAMNQLAGPEWAMLQGDGVLLFVLLFQFLMGAASLRRGMPQG